ncbi:MAG: HEAT repeat domain-containing protein, partial [Pirellula sp.]
MSTTVNRFDTPGLRCLPMLMECCSMVLAIVLGSVCWLGFGVAHAQPPQPLQHAWELSPNFGDVWSMTKPARSYFVNVENLDSSDTELRLITAQLICLNHDKDGFKGGDRAIELLMARLKSNSEPLLVRRVMVSAVCLLDDGTHAASLWEIARDDMDMRATVARALAKWKKPIALEYWRERVRSPATNSFDLAFALEGLASVGTAEDRQSLVSCMRSNTVSESNRVLASLALGATNASGMNGLAEELLASELVDRYTLAANLLRHHSDEESLSKLLVIMNSGPNTARRIVAEAIAAHFPQKAIELAPGWTTDSDNNLRRLALVVLKGINSTEATKLQATLLGDTNVEVRNLAREQLLGIAQGDMRSVVDACVSEQLESSNWRGIEQSVILSTQLRDRSRCDTFVRLLDHPQAEVYMHAGWGLMELADTPEILERIQK